MSVGEMEVVVNTIAGGIEELDGTGTLYLILSQGYFFVVLALFVKCLCLGTYKNDSLLPNCSELCV